MKTTLLLLAAVALACFWLWLKDITKPDTTNEYHDSRWEGRYRNPNYQAK